MRFHKSFRAVNCLVAICLSVPAMAALPQYPATRKFEGSNLDLFVASLQAKDSAKVSEWFSEMSGGLREAGSEVEMQAADSFVNLSKVTELTKLAPAIFREQMRLRKYFSLKSASGMLAEKNVNTFLQILLEESVMYTSQKTKQNEFLFKASSLTSQEQTSAGKIRNIDVVPGDIIVQIGANYLSSHFIAHSQTSPGMASHGLLVSKGGANPEVLEALIEDGVNRRDPTKAQLARMWVLSLADAGERAKTKASTEDFITQEKIPFVAGEGHGKNSPLRYDSTMNFERVKEGKYFCTALVQEVYNRAGVGADQSPYVSSNGNFVSGLEAEIYTYLGIKTGSIAAPSDALVQPNFKIRGLFLDADGLRSSRRLRAVVDAFFDILGADAKSRNDLMIPLNKIPSQEVSKEEILVMVDKVPELAKFRSQLEENLPQTANLRQIGFFILLNNVIQDKALAGLKDFEVNQLKRHATPGELRAAAVQFLAPQIVKLTEMAKSFTRP